MSATSSRVFANVWSKIRESFTKIDGPPRQFPDMRPAGPLVCSYRLVSWSCGSAPAKVYFVYYFCDECSANSPANVPRWGPRKFFFLAKMAVSGTRNFRQPSCTHRVRKRVYPLYGCGRHWASSRHQVTLHPDSDLSSDLASGSPLTDRILRLRF